MAEVASTSVVLSLWRVFGMTDIFHDRPEEWPVVAPAGPVAGDQLRLSLGAVPNDLVRSVTEWSAQGNARLSMRLGHIESREQAQAQYEADLEHADASIFDEPYPMAFTLRLTRGLQVGGSIAHDLYWAEGLPSLSDNVAAFEKVGNSYLDAVIPYLIEPMAPMNFGRLLYAERRAFCTAHERPACLTARFSLSIADWGAQVTRAGGWAAAPTMPLAQALADLPTGSRPGALTSGASEFFMLAVAEEDSLRRFVFAFAGLEHLATQVASKRRARLTQRLVELDEAMPVQELIWPEQQPDRGLRFRLATLIYLYSPVTAAADVAQANELVAFRNKLFHGVNSDTEFRNQSIACKELLRRYLGLVAGAEGPG